MAKVLVTANADATKTNLEEVRDNYRHLHRMMSELKQCTNKREKSYCIIRINNALNNVLTITAQRQKEHDRQMIDSGIRRARFIIQEYEASLIGEI